MKKLIGSELPEAALGHVQGGASVTVYQGDDYTGKVDLKPIVETVKWVWKKFKSWF